MVRSSWADRAGRGEGGDESDDDDVDDGCRGTGDRDRDLVVVDCDMITI
jgi:hypothetical protein